MRLSSQAFMTSLLSAIGWWYPEEVDLSFRPADVLQNELSEEYDFIIVGAGSAGCVVANRVSANPDWSVLLVEAGNDGSEETDVPLLYAKWKHSKYNWNYTTVEQRRACLATGGRCDYPRGRVMGGSSTINEMMYIRGHKLDYDGWAKLGNIGWSYNDILPLFIKTENSSESNLSSDFHGKQGLLHVQYPNYHTPLRDEYIKAGLEMGWFKRDFNAGIQQNSIDYNQVMMDGPSRDSTSKAYLNPVRQRKNLSIIKNSLVKKIFIDTSNSATGIEFDRNGVTHSVKVRKEIIISAGAINTAQLLMLSGIGPRDELLKHGIHFMSNLPVGKYLQDHIYVPLYFKINKNVTISPNIWKTDKAIFNYVKNRNGSLTSTGMETLAFINPQIRKAPPTISYIFSSFLNDYDNPPDEQIITIFVGLIKPKSWGKLTLKSNNPYDYPNIDPNYLSEKIDFDNLYRGIQIIFKFMKTPTMSKYLPKMYEKYTPNCSIYKKPFIRCLIEQYSETYVHPVATARMGPSGDNFSVVDPNLKVKGFKNLRVVDSSVMPYIPRATMNAPTIMIAEKASEFIRTEHSMNLSNN